MLVHVIPMHMVEMAVVKIIHVAPVANGDVSTIRAMLMGVVGMVFLGTCVHCRRSLLGCAIWHPVIFTFRGDREPASPTGQNRFTLF
jgi:hypothetical protein